MTMLLLNGAIAETPVKLTDKIRVSVPNLTDIDRQVYGPLAFDPIVSGKGGTRIPQRGDTAVVGVDEATGEQWIVRWHRPDTTLPPYSEDGGGGGGTGATGYDTAPIGAIITTSRRSWGNEYVLADGQQLTEAAYPDCANVAAAEVAAGNPLWTISGVAPNRTFTVPDLRNRFIYSTGTKTQGIKSQTNPALANPGEELHQVTIAEMPSHSHSGVSGFADRSLSHTHRSIADGQAANTLFDRQYFNGGYAQLAATGGSGWWASDSITGSGGVDHKHGISAEGGGGLHNNMPPYCVLVMIVKVKGVSTSVDIITGPTGPQGVPGTPGAPGAQGPAGPGVAVGGTAGQILSKIDATNYNTQWINQPSSAPSGPAGGDLSGTYPNPQIAGGVIVDADVNAANKDGAVATPSMRTIGTGAQQAMAGNTRLDTIAAPTGNVGLNYNRITNLADPTADYDAATKNYVDSVAQGLDAKMSAKVATTANVSNLMLNAPSTVDGVALTLYDRILVKSQTNPAENGIYKCNMVGTGANGNWVRATDMDSWAEVPGSFVWVEQGTLYADTGWVCVSDQGGSLGSTAITWTQFSGAAMITAGAGLTKTGNTLDVGAGNGITVAADTISVPNSSTSQRGIVQLCLLGADLGSDVKALAGNIPLSSINPPDSWMNLNNQGITALADPSSAQDAATKAYVDNNSGHTIKDEGTSRTQRKNLNFVGSGVTATDDSANNATVVTIPGGGAGHTIQDEGVAFAQRTGLNFVGSGVIVSDDSANNATVINVPAASINAGSAWASAVGSQVDISGAWRNVPIPVLAMEPAGAFVVSGNNVTVAEAGWYDVSASLLCVSASTNSIFLSLSTLTSAGDGNIANGGNTAVYSRCTAAGSVKLAAGAKVYVYGWSNGASPVNCYLAAFSITKVGGPKGDKGDTGGSATVPIDPWHQVGAAGEPAFQNGWAAFDSNVYFRKDPLGRVWLRGSLSAGANGTVAFTLPVGYRPVLTGLTRVRAIAIDNQTAVGQWEGQINIGTDGAVLVYTTKAGANIALSLDQITFDTGTVTAMPTGPQGPPGPTATVPIEAWRTVGAAGQPPFQNGWTSLGAAWPPQFRKRPDGVVEMRGILKVGTLGQAAFVLPSGYLPSTGNSELYFAEYGNGAFSGLYVSSSTGAVVPTIGSAGSWISLDNVRYSTDQTDFPTGPQGPPGIQGPPGSSIPVVTTLPGTSGLPDGYEVYFKFNQIVGSPAANPEPRLWHLRYDASQPTYKWIPVGAQEPVTTYDPLARSVGVSVGFFTLDQIYARAPLAGLYRMVHGSDFMLSSVLQNLYTALYVNGTWTALGSIGSGQTSTWSTAGGLHRAVINNAGTDVYWGGQATVASTISATGRYVSLYPVWLAGPA